VIYAAAQDESSHQPAATAAALSDTPAVVPIAGTLTYTKTNSTADAAAPPAVALAYATAAGAGAGGTWDGYRYGDARDYTPSKHCPSTRRVVSSNIARCQCVTQDSLNAYYSGKR
jgi:hypothetical protein